jgi:hypothetical protein
MRKNYDFSKSRPNPYAKRFKSKVPKQNGKAAAVPQFATAVQEGLADLKAGRVVSHDELGRLLDARFGPLNGPKKDLKPRTLRSRSKPASRLK